MLYLLFKSLKSKTDNLIKIKTKISMNMKNSMMNIIQM